MVMPCCELHQYVDLNMNHLYTHRIYFYFYPNPLKEYSTVFTGDYSKFWQTALIMHITVLFHGTCDLPMRTDDTIWINETKETYMTGLDSLFLDADTLSCVCCQSEGFSDFSVRLFIWVCVSTVL